MLVAGEEAQRRHGPGGFASHVPVPRAGQSCIVLGPHMGLDALVFHNLMAEGGLSVLLAYEYAAEQLERQGHLEWFSSTLPEDHPVTRLQIEAGHLLDTFLTFSATQTNTICYRQSRLPDPFKTDLTRCLPTSDAPKSGPTSPTPSPGSTASS